MSTLRDYQGAALGRWKAVTTGGGTRATLVLPTGTGKTVVAAQILPTHVTAKAVFFVPTVVLLDQTCRHLLTAHPHLRALRVCSVTAPALDEDGDLTEAQLAARTHIDATTNPDEIANHLRAAGPAVLIATYASAAAVHEAATATGTIFDLCICDEAHRTAGAPGKAWSLPIHADFPAHRRLFMTATARTIVVPNTPSATAAITEIGWDTADIISMDSLENYGPHINTLTFRDAINQGHLSDYNIAIIGITSRDAHKQLAQITASIAADYSITDAAAHLALARATSTHPHIHSVLAFHNRIAASRTWTQRLPAVYRQISADSDTPQRLINAIHVDGTSDPDEQRQALNDLAHPGDRLCVVSNCRVFAEGVDVPSIDAVLFAAPRTAGPDIIQIIGRAVRPHPHGPKRKALIIVPVILPTDSEDTAADLAAARTSYLAAWRILTSLADQDELLHQSLLTWRSTPVSNKTPTAGPLLIDLPDGLESIVQDVFLRTIDRTIPTHLRTAAYLSDYHAVHGHTRTRPHTTFRAYPLGAAMRAAQAAHRAHTLPPRIIEQFEAIPGFAWTTSKAAIQRTADQWIDLIGHYVTKTGIHTIDRADFVTDPNTGAPAQIGQWYHTKAARKNYLTATERHRLAAILTG